MHAHTQPNADRETARRFLAQALNSKSADFRDGQWEAIASLIYQQTKLLVVQRTGWGKSLVYFIATRLFRDRGSGPTLIVSPLLALMRNQIEAADRLGLKALTINSTNSDAWDAHTHALLNDQADVLLVSPERLANDQFVQDVLLPISHRIGLLVVDEAHCISDWGHDFRPDYRRLVNILRRMPPNLPILGTTATANNRVIKDITQQLGDVQLQRGPLLRTSLALQTLRLPDQAARLAWLVEHLSKMPGTGIIYTLTKRDADQVAGWLNQNGIAAQAYYSDVQSPSASATAAYREQLEAALLNNELKALVATSALGMGYDKPDLGFVIHYQTPGSIIAYYQQVGRAGRAIDHAFGILLAGREDTDIQRYFRDRAFPAEAHVAAILAALEASDGRTERQLEVDVNLRKGQITHVLKFLSVENPAPVFKQGASWRRTAVPYKLDQAHIERLTQQREQEWHEIQTYIDSRECLMMFLAQALDDGTAQPCGKCAPCVGRPLIADTYSHELAVAAARYLKQAELPLVCKKQVAADAFPLYGFSGNLPLDLRAEPGRILSRWGDAGWGRLVAEDKHAGRFGAALVDGLVELISTRWRPVPAPTWLTCVPSLRHPTLVPDFAERVAHKLGLPFVAAVVKGQHNQPQKLQHNRFYQCHNLDGVFTIRPDLPDGPVLLLDDIVDSSWTMTVVSALLKQAGVSAVYPVALAETTSGD